MRKLKLSVLVLLISALPLQAQETGTVVVEGFGKNIESAVQSAAEAALMQVVGTFIDTATFSEVRQEIKDAVVSQSEKFTEKSSEYSQGSIARLDVLDAKTDNGLIRVIAKVTVRIEDFKHYIKETVLAEKKIKKGLLGQLKVDEKQEQNITQLIIDKVLNPLMGYQAIVLKITGEISQETNPSILSEINKLFPEDGYVIRIPVEAVLNPEFLANAKRVLDETSEKKYRGTQLKKAQKVQNYEYSVWLGKWWGEKLVGLNKYLPRQSIWNITNMPKGVAGPPTVYLFPARTAEELCQGTADTVGKPDLKNKYFIPTLELSFVSGGGEVLREEMLTLGRHGRTYLTSDHSIVIVESNEKNPRRNSLPDLLKPNGHINQKLVYGALSTTVLYFYQQPGKTVCRVYIPTSTQFYIVSKVSEHVLGNAAKISLKFSN